MAFLDDLGDAKVADFDTFLAVKQNVVQLDVSVDDGAAVNMGQSIDDLLEDELAVLLF